MRHLFAIGTALVVAFAALPASALHGKNPSEDAAQQDLTLNEGWCWDSYEEYTPEQQIEGCNGLLAAGSLSDEDKPYVIAMRGWSYHELKDYDRALADFSEKIRLQPDAADGYGWRGGVYFDKGEYDHALADYTWAIHLGPEELDTPVWYHDRGMVKRELGDLAGALRDYDEALERSPDAQTYVGRGYVYFDQKKYERAIEDFSMAIELGTNESSNWNERCWARAVWGEQLEEAMDDCDQALWIDPENSYAYDSRGLVHLRLGNWDSALLDYQSARDIDPAASAYFGHGIALKRLGNDEEAAADFAKAAEIDPKIAETYAGYGIKP